MAKLFNRAKMKTTTTGSGTVTLTTASDGYQTFAAAGVADSDVVQYVIEDGTNWEIGTGTYSATGTSLTRSPTESSNAGAAISLTGAAEVFITAVAADLNRLQDAGSTKVEATSTGATVTGNITVTGTVDGRDVATDGAKLDGIESGATADQTKADIDALNIDADTVDGLHASSFIRSDADDTYTGVITGNQLYVGGSEITSSSAKLQVNGFQRTGTIYLHEGTAAGSNNYPLETVGSELRWNTSKIWTAANDGSGSGLDADTLDGVQASSFIRSDAADNVSANTEWQDNAKVILGAGADFQMWHDGTNTYFRNYLHAAGSFYWQGEGTGGVNHNLISMHNDTTTPYVRLYYDSAQVLETVSGGISIPDYIYHTGDTDTRIVFATDTITLQTAGSSEITVNTTGVRLGDTGNGYFQPVSGNYGSIQVDGGAHGGYEGYSIGGRAVFMHNNSTTTGIYNDVDNEWLFAATHNGAARMYYNGSNNFETTSTGAQVNGDLTVTGSISGSGGAKVWASWDGAGTAALRADIGVSSLTDQGTGRYYLNLSTAAPNVNYATTGDTSNNDPIYTTGDDFATTFGRGHRTSTTLIEALSSYTYSPAPRDGGNYCSTLAFW